MMQFFTTLISKIKTQKEQVLWSTLFILFFLAIGVSAFILLKGNPSPILNTTIVKASGGYAYKNTTNTFKTQFKANPTTLDGIVFENNLGKISFYTPITQSFGELKPPGFPTTNGSTITYYNIFPQMDLSYTITSSRLLEEFIVKDSITAQFLSRIEQRATTDNTYKENEDGSISFFNPKKDNSLAFTLPHPVMYEVGDPNQKSTGIIYEITPYKDQLIITKVITEQGQAWLADKNRNYPITIDLVIDNADALSANTVIDNGDTSSNWTSSDATNSTVSQETTIKQEGTGSTKVQTTAGGAATTVDLMEYSSNGTAQTAYVTNASTFSATGGTITTSGGYTIHTFISSGTFTPSGSGTVEYLVVAGGGSGGPSYTSGGGGGGGFRTGTGLAVSAGSPITVTVGAGGSGLASNGEDSVFSSITATGGGKGGGSPAAGNGGSGGGGGGYYMTAPGNGNLGGFSPVEGYNGGNAYDSTKRQAGGGGGASAVGFDATSSAAGNGGDGIASSISGSSVTYAGGGGGGAYQLNGGVAGSGGSGGGGNGSISGNGNAGTVNTGGGGGGCGYNFTAGAGGSGIVIVRYPTGGALQAYNGSGIGTGGTITTSGSNTIHTFTSSGTFTPSMSGNVEYLVIGGGGGGGYWNPRGPGGGGAGGYRSNVSGESSGGGAAAEAPFSVTSGTNYTVTVGDGGAGSSIGGAGTNGSDSVFSTITSIGGGGGGGDANGTNSTAGGSGGGGGYMGGGASSGTSNQGYAGGAGGTTLYTPSDAGGGGGGAGGIGGNGSSSGSGSGGTSGVGISSSITGSAVIRAGGGGGGNGNGLGGSASGGGGTGGGTGGAGTANTGGGGGGDGNVGGGGNGGSGVVIIRYTTPSAIKSEGSYSLKGIASITTSLNKTLTRTIDSPLNLSDKASVTADIRASRTGSNIKVGIHDVGGITTEVTPNITQADTFQSATIDLSGVTNANKDAIDQIIITIVNADAANTFYIDNMVAIAPSSLNDTITRTVSATDLSVATSLTYYVRSSVAGSYATFGFGESAATEQTNNITINQANTWEQKTWDISGISSASRNAVTKFAFTFTGDTSGASFYFDDIQSVISPTWVSSDATNTIVSVETTIKQEGSGSVKVQTAVGGASVNVDLMEYASDGTAQTAFVTNATGVDDSYSKVLLHMNGSDASTTFTDESGKTWTVGGNAQIDTAQSKFGGSSVLFDGTNDYLSTPDSADFAFGTGAFTIDFWVRFNDIHAGTNSFIMIQRYDVNNQIQLLYDGSQWRFVDVAAGISSAQNSTLSINTWYHMALVRTGNDFMWFQNGVQLGSTVTSAASMSNIAEVVVLGAFYPNTETQNVNGWIDEFRVSKGIARWTSNFTPPTSPYTSLQAYNSDTNGTGGTITTSGANTIHTFTSSGTFTPSGSGNVEYLVVAGGGGGGASSGGGGGAGGFLTATGFAVTPQGYTVTVGNGGAGGTMNNNRGTSGSNSVFSTITATGGGGGGADAIYSGINGGSGGGSYYGGAIGNGTGGQGNNGGLGTTSPNNYGSGGGGGASAVGGNGTSTVGGNGGAGTASSISGSSVTYAGGGGGASQSGGTPGTGGAGGGGNGGISPTAGTANTGGGGGGGSYNAGYYPGAAGGSGIVIVSYPTPSAIKSEGSYSLKGIAAITTSLNKTLTRTIASPLNLSDKPNVTFDIRASRTGSNIKVGLHDSGGITTEVTPNVTSADTFQSATIDLSGVTNANKDAIDQIIITIVNADAANTFYLDNMVATAPTSLNDTVTRSSASTDLSSVANITYWVRSTVAGSYATFGFGESAATEQTNTITINQANTWEQKSFDITGITGTSRDAVTKYAFIFHADPGGASFYFDDIQTNALFAPTLGTATSLTNSSIRWNFTDNSSEETGFKVYDSNSSLLVTCAAANLTSCDETGLTPNTQYTRKIGTYNASTTSIASGTVSGYTLAVAPGVPTVNTRTTTTVNVNPDPGTNAASTTMAIYKETGTTCDGSGGSYIAANGSDNGATAVWQTDATWSTVTVTGLTSETSYAFCVKAKNGENVETAFSTVGQNNSGYVPLSGDFAITANTSILNKYVDGSDATRYVMGVDSGTGSSNTAILDLQSGVLTVNANETVVAGSFSLAGGSIAIANGGQLKPGSALWAIDADADGYTSDAKLYYGTQPTNGRRKNLITTLGTADCGDSSYSTANTCFMSATGGTITTSGNYKIHTFTGSGTFTPSGSGNVEVLVVAGGGGGGGTHGSAAVGGGGGGGGVQYNASYAVSGATTVTIGAEGARGQCANVGDGCPYATGTSGGNGGSSIFGTITAVGGGGGGYGNATAGLNGANGGGGGTYFGNGGTGTSGYGGGQGSDCNTPCRAGGGGGAGAAGVAGATNGNGGIGYNSSISGSSVYYGGGAAGNGYSNNNGTPGSGGGAVGYVCSVNGSTGCTNGASGTSNTGGGGAGASGSGRGWGGLGGSGIVIVKYQFQ